MSGLILAGIGGGIARGGERIGDMMARAAEREGELQERLAARAEEKHLDRQNRLEIAQLIHGSKGGSGSGGSGGGAGGAGNGSVGRTSDLSPIELDGMAAQMGISVPELQKFLTAHRTGDTSAYKVETREYNDPSMAEATTTSSLPPEFDSFMEGKRKQLAEQLRQRSFGGTGMKGLADSEQTYQTMGLVSRAMTNPQDAPTIGQATAAATGKPLQGGNSDVTRNLFTGSTQTTEVGKSVINENKAQAGAANARAKNEGQAPQSTPSAMLNALQGRIKDIRESLKGLDFVDDKAGEAAARRQLIELQEQAAAIAKSIGKTPASASDKKPAAAISSLPKDSVAIGTSGGKTVYQTPDGRQFIAK